MCSLRWSDGGFTHSNNKIKKNKLQEKSLCGVRTAHHRIAPQMPRHHNMAEYTHIMIYLHPIRNCGAVKPKRRRSRIRYLPIYFILVLGVNALRARYTFGL